MLCIHLQRAGELHNQKPFILNLKVGRTAFSYDYYFRTSLITFEYVSVEPKVVANSSVIIFGV